MLKDKRMPTQVPCAGAVVIGWYDGGTAVPDSLLGLLQKDGYALKRVAKGEDDLSSRIALLILDCKDVDASTVQKNLADIYAKDALLRIALWAVDATIEPAQLMRWPGVQGIFRADVDEEQLRKGVQALLDGESWLPRRMMELWLEQQRSRTPPVDPLLSDALTDRERQILGRVGQASTNAQIAYDLCISEHTVKTHLYNIYRKIKVRNRTEACNWIRGNVQLIVS